MKKILGRSQILQGIGADTRLKTQGGAVCLGDEVSFSRTLFDLKGGKRVFNVSNGSVERQVGIKGPFEYLGHGAEKIVFSAEVSDLEDFTGSFSSRVAVALSEHEKRRSSLGTFRLATETGLPTYEWFFTSPEGLLLMPNLRENSGWIVTYNNVDNVILAHDPQQFDLIRQKSDEIMAQLERILRACDYGARSLQVMGDTYYLHFDNSGVRVILGDLDARSIQDLRDRIRELKENTPQKDAEFVTDSAIHGLIRGYNEQQTDWIVQFLKIVKRRLLKV